MTQNIVDELTDTPSDRNQECVGQGIANTLTGFIGGMAGCAMIGQSMINVKSGGRGRLSTFVAGVFLLILVVGLGDYVSRIPMAALVAIMVMVSIGTFSWSSLKALRTHPRSSSVVMLAVVGTVVGTPTSRSACWSACCCRASSSPARSRSCSPSRSVLSADGRERTYHIEGQLFFASAEEFMRAFDFREALERVTVDVSRAHIWDISSVAALDMAVLKFRREGAEVKIVGLNEASETIVDRLAIHDKPGAMDQLMAH